MHRSPIALLALLIVITAAASVWAQSNPPAADPQQGAGLPQTPMKGTQANSPNPAPQASDTKPNAATATPTPDTLPVDQKPQAPASSKPGTKPSGQQTPGAQQQGAAQPVAPQAELPAPPAQPKTEILDSSATSGA